MKFKVWVKTDYIGSKSEQIVEIDDEELSGMDEKERIEYIEELCKEAMFDMIEWDYLEVD